MSDGKVNIQDLVSEDVFAILKPEFLSLLKSKVKGDNSFPELSTKLGTSKRILERSLNGESAMRFDIFNKIMSSINLTIGDVADQIASLRGVSGGELPNPAIQFDFTTTAGIRLVAAMLGDGCLDIRHRVAYSNSNPELIKGFIDDIKVVFGNKAEYTVYTRIKPNGNNVQVVELPPVYGTIISKIDIIPGKKVENNPNIPKFIFGLTNDKILEFISQLFDDEGCVNLAAGHLSIHFGLVESERESNLMRGMETLFLRIGILVSVYKEKIYFRKNSENRRLWRLQICGSFQIKNLKLMLNLRHKEKAIKLDKLASSFKSEQYLKRNCTQIYLSCMVKIQKANGYFTSQDLVRPLKRKVGHIRNMLHKYLNKGLISQIDAPSLTYQGAYPAKYVVNHENSSGSTHS